VEHEATTKKLVASVLLGSVDPWNNTELKAFRDGFNIDLGNKTLLEVNCTLSFANIMTHFYPRHSIFKSSQTFVALYLLKQVIDALLRFPKSLINSNLRPTTRGRRN
jgi:hypothetical protein